MSARASAFLAWTIGGLTVAVLTAHLVLLIADPAAAGPATNGSATTLPVAAIELWLLGALALVASFVAARRPRNPVGWLLCVVPLSLALLELSSTIYWHVALAHPGGSRVADLAAWAYSWLWIPAMVSLLTFVPLLFPTGRPPTPRWRPVGWVAGVAGAVSLVTTMIAPGPLVDHENVDNPLGAGGLPTDVLESVAFAIWLLTTVVALASLVVRFRRSTGVERQQLRWFTAAAAFLVVLFPAAFALGADAVFFTGLLIGLLVLAVAVAIAILRYRLYDIDVVINRALVYGGLTATLAGTYLVSVLLLQLALSPLTSTSELAVAGSTLAVAAAFRPARARIQAVVDRRFFRRRYDAARTLEGFSARLRDEVELDALSAELRAVVVETVQPAHLSLWLRSEAER